MSPWLCAASLWANTRPPVHRLDARRPALSGPVEHAEIDGFRVHFTRSGSDAPPDDDTDADKLPDLVDAILAGLATGTTAFEEEGFRPLIGDGTAGGDDAIDVYVTDIDAYGYAIPTSTGGQGWSCYIEIDPDTDVFGRIAESVAVHELHHCVQFRYNPNLASWIYEAGATYEQYSHVRDPVLDVALGSLYAMRLDATELKLATTVDRLEYAGFLWMKFWTEFEGYDPDRLPRMWEILADAQGWRPGLQLASEEIFGLPLGQLFLHHAAWNGFACGGSDGLHYLDDPLPCVTESSVPLIPWDGDAPMEIHHSEGPFTSESLDLTPKLTPERDTELTLTCEGQEGLRYALVHLVGGRGVQLTEDVAPSVRRPTLSLARGDRARAVVVGTETPLNATCSVELWQPGPAGCASTSSLAPVSWALGLLGALLLRRGGAPLAP
ncbi:MAG TPA: hypothetical protein ENK18_16790 [Deltaproteobacteria bacterium]|nr:hypothetical protein [Deltaproteobacteria bacterium]